MAADSETDVFGPTKRTTIVVGLVATVAALLLLVVVAALAPSGDLLCTAQDTAAAAGQEAADVDQGQLKCASADEGFQLSSTWAMVLGTVLSTVLAAGLISLALDFGIRRRFGVDLLRFLNLKAALVRSGLAELDMSSQCDLRTDLQRTDHLRYVGRTPNLWLNEHLPLLLRIAESRRMEMTFGLPNPDNDESIRAAAASLGGRPEDVRDSVLAFTRSAEAQWQAAEGRLVAGTLLRIVYVDEPLQYDAVDGTAFAAMMLGQPYSHDPRESQLSAVFRSNGATFPSAWVRASLMQLASMTSAWEGGPA